VACSRLIQLLVVAVMACNVLRLGLGLYWVIWQIVRHTTPTGNYSGMTTFPNAMFFYPSVRSAIFVFFAFLAKKLTKNCSFAFAHSILVYLVPDVVTTLLFLFFIARHQLAFRFARRQNQNECGEPLLITVPTQYEAI
jgi:hypothetical protein